MTTLLKGPLLRAELGICCKSPASLLTYSQWTPSSYVGTVLRFRQESKTRALPRQPRSMARAAAASGGPLVVTHTVAPGESLYSIASGHGVTVEELLLENPHVEAAKLQPGTVLVIDDGIHQRLSQQEVKEAARGGGGRRTTGSWASGIQVLPPSLPSAVGPSDWACLAGAALLAATLGIAAARQWHQEEEEQSPAAEESGSPPAKQSSSAEQGRTHSDEELAGLLRDAAECIAHLQSELAEQQGQQKELQAKVATLERKLETSHQRR